MKPIDLLGLSLWAKEQALLYDHHRDTEIRLHHRVGTSSKIRHSCVVAMAHASRLGGLHSFCIAAISIVGFVCE